MRTWGHVWDKHKDMGHTQGHGDTWGTHTRTWGTHGTDMRTWGCVWDMQEDMGTHMGHAGDRQRDMWGDPWEDTGPCMGQTQGHGDTCETDMRTWGHAWDTHEDTRTSIGTWGHTWGTHKATGTGMVTPKPHQ